MTVRFLLVLLMLSWTSTAFAQVTEKIMEKPETYEVVVRKLSRAPVLDGDDADWAEIPGSVIRVSPAQADDPLNYLWTVNVLLKAGYYEESVYFMIK